MWALQNIKSTELNATLERLSRVPHFTTTMPLQNCEVEGLEHLCRAALLYLRGGQQDRCKLIQAFLFGRYKTNDVFDAHEEAQADVQRFITKVMDRQPHDQARSAAAVSMATDHVRVTKLFFEGAGVEEEENRIKRLMNLLDLSLYI